MSKWFRGLRGKLSAIIGAAIVAVIALNVANYIGIKRMSAEIHEITDVRMPSIQGLEEMNEGQTAVNQMIAYMQYSTAKAEFDQYVSRFKAKKKQIKDGWDLYAPLPQTTEEAAEWKITEKTWKEWENAVDKYLEAKLKGDEEAAKEYYHLQREATGPSKESLEKVIAMNYQIAEDSKHAAVEASTKTQIISNVGGAVACIFVFIFGVTLASRTSNLLADLATNLNDSTTQVSSAALQISSSSVELSQSTTEQAASLEETAASLEEMSSMVAKNTENAKNTASTSVQSEQKATEGKQAVERMLVSMEEINQSNAAIMDQVNQSNQQMTEIVKVIQEIGNKTKVINDIVFQTKLLSFNASVEAARAGEHGKGFAVVAEEVGKLAQMSGNAAKEISDMLAGSISKVENIVRDTKAKVEVLIAQGKQKVETGVDLASQCSDLLNEIVTNVSKVAAMSNEISMASEEQRQGITEINKAMNQLDQVTQQNASATEQTAGAAESLSAQAESLKFAVNQLVLTIEGHRKNQTADGKERKNERAQEKNENVISLTERRNKQSDSGSKLKMASGDNTIPSGDHSGFSDV